MYEDHNAVSLGGQNHKQKAKDDDDAAHSKPPPKYIR